MESMSAEIFLITHPRVVFFFFCSYQSIKTRANTLLFTQKLFCFLLKYRFLTAKNRQSAFLHDSRRLRRYVCLTSRDKHRLFTAKNCPWATSEKVRNFHTTKELCENNFYMDNYVLSVICMTF